VFEKADDLQAGILLIRTDQFDRYFHAEEFCIKDIFLRGRRFRGAYSCSGVFFHDGQMHVVIRTPGLLQAAQGLHSIWWFLPI
jgi:hypothetical protein